MTGAAAAEQPVKVGLLPPMPWMATPAQERLSLLRKIADAGIDHLAVGDHISFRSTYGFDGIVNATSILAAEPRLSAVIAVYLLPHRHPVPVARQLSSLAELAPGRLIFGIGVGGEDATEAEICGVDNRTRGRRATESLGLLRRLLSGETVTARGDFFRFDSATIGPAPQPAIPVLVGGRSDAAIYRAAALGDGWLGIWVSVARFTEVTRSIAVMAAELGRDEPPQAHAMNVWCAFDKDPERAESILAAEMGDSYGIPYERFRKWCPTGTPASVAEQLLAYRDAGCTVFNLLARGTDEDSIIDGVAEVRERLIS